MFIEVTSTNGSKILVNLAHVCEVIKSTIYFTNKNEYVNCVESYDTIKQKIQMAGAKI
jgi:hypothetical protein